MRRRAWWLVLGMMAVAGMAGCADGLTPREVVGRWEGYAGNGADIPGDVPLRVGAGRDTVNFVHSRFQLSTADRCSYYVALGDPPSQNLNENCRYTVDGNVGTITITLDGEYTISGTIAIGSMILTWPNAGGEPNVFEYAKD